MTVVSADEVDAEDGATFDCPASADDLAYVLYTSGSTGDPKGVMISHAASLAFVRWAASTFDLRAEDRVANFAPYHFDLSTFDLYAAASVGAAVCPVPSTLSIFPQAIVKDWARQTPTSVWYTTPTTLALLLHRGGLGATPLPELRLVLFAGEVMSPASLRELMRALPTTQFANLYGPTETNVCTWWPVRAAPVDDTPLPIGRPCCGDAAWILDDRRRPVPAGDSGELWISGPTLLSGYWNRPDLTAAALQRIEGAPGRYVTAYRTGDLVQLQRDGSLAFLGRRDNQVKVRGFRVELGEIETTLHQHPAVAEAVATPLTGGGRDALGAIVTLRRELPMASGALQRFCAEALPPYMVPEKILVAERLPSTSSGKVDRRAAAALLLESS